jgi:hypothetical protein
MDNTQVKLQTLISAPGKKNKYNNKSMIPKLIKHTIPRKRPLPTRDLFTKSTVGATQDNSASSTLRATSVDLLKDY